MLSTARVTGQGQIRFAERAQDFGFGIAIRADVFVNWHKEIIHCWGNCIPCSVRTREASLKNYGVMSATIESN